MPTEPTPTARTIETHRTHPGGGPAGGLTDSPATSPAGLAVEMRGIYKSFDTTSVLRDVGRCGESRSPYACAGSV